MSCHWPQGWAERTLPARLHTSAGKGFAEGEGEAKCEEEGKAKGERSGYMNSVSASAWAPFSQLRR